MTSALHAAFSRLIQPADLELIASKQDGPREPIVDELSHLLQSTTVGAPTTEAAHAAHGLLAWNIREPAYLTTFAYYILAESALAAPSRDTSFFIGSFLPRTLDSVVRLDVSTRDAFGAWLRTCAARVRVDATTFEASRVRVFFSLAALMIQMYDLALIAREVGSLASAERALVDNFMKAHDGELTESAFDLDAYLSCRDEWQTLWQKLAGDLRVAVDQVSVHLTTAAGTDGD